jgi:UDP-N-acetyl-D-glucosamine dehydrogenase
VTYKRDVDDISSSPALEILSRLHALGALVSYSDPNVPMLPASAWQGGVDLASTEFTHEAVASHDCTVILADHSAFDYELLVSAAPLIVDTRNAVRRDTPRLFRLGAPLPPASQAASAWPPDVKRRREATAAVGI